MACTVSTPRRPTDVWSRTIRLDGSRIEAHRDQLEAYEGLCRDLSAKPADVALAWLLGTPSSRPRSSEPYRSRSCTQTSAL
jgi:aryl-alcohol dehydrogenase-like predicted oxidoreductase